MNPKIIFFILLHGIFATFEQVLFKKTAHKFDTHGIRGLKGYFFYILNIFKLPAIWLAFLMIFFAWVTWFVVIAWLDLSIAIPVDSIQYIMIIAVSYFLLKEKFNWQKIWGTILILAGITLVALS